MLSQLLDSLNTLLWGRLLLPSLIGIGLFLTLKLDFPQIRKFGQAFRLTVGRIALSSKRKKSNLLSAWETASTALASTIGTGSIVGVAVAIKVGGPGTLFWMWVSAFLGMAIKYTEILLAMFYRNRSEFDIACGGPMLYLQKGVGSRFLASFFAVFCIFVSLLMGNSVQSNTIASVLDNQLDFPPLFSGAILTIITAFVILGGTKRIASLNAKLVPFMSLLYIGCCFAILITKYSILPQIFNMIFREAFSVSSFIGGTSSYGILLAMKNGFAKGVFSNEAGLGSSPIAHACSDSDDLEEQGAWGIFEVFFTTVVICTLTGLVILSSDFWCFNEMSAVDLTYRAFQGFPFLGGAVLSASTVLFSLSTILGWAFYGEVCLRFLFREHKKYCLIYRMIYVVTVFFGALVQNDLIWSLSELANGLMMIPNLVGIVCLSGALQSKN